MTLALIIWRWTNDVRLAARTVGEAVAMVTLRALVAVCALVLGCVLLVLAGLAIRWQPVGTVVGATGATVGLLAGHRWRTRLRDLIDYVGEDNVTLKRANRLAVDTVDELRGELARISSEHPAVGDGLDVPNWVNGEAVRS